MEQATGNRLGGAFYHPRRADDQQIVSIGGADRNCVTDARWAGQARHHSWSIGFDCGVWMLCGRQFDGARAKPVNPGSVGRRSLLISAVISVPAALWLKQPRKTGRCLYKALLWLAVISTAFAFSLRYILIERAGAGFMANVGYLIPVVALLIGFFCWMRQ